MDFILREASVTTPHSPLWQQGPRRIAVLALSMLLLGCGQKGPLTLPAPASAASAPAAPK